MKCKPNTVYNRVKYKNIYKICLNLMKSDKKN